MPRTLNKLTDSQIRSATFKKLGKSKKLSDGGGLYLHVLPTGRFWRMKYRHGGKEKLLTVGQYPQMGLKEARAGRDQAKALLADGIDPVQHRRAAKQERVVANENTFASVTEDFLTTVYYHKVKEITYTKNKQHLKNHALLALGSRPVNEITPIEVLTVLRRMDDKPETQNRVKQLLSMIFRFSVVTGRADRDPTADLRGLTRPVKNNHFPAITDPAELRGLLLAIDAYSGSPEVLSALRLLPLVFLRSENLRKLLWSQVNFRDGQLEIEETKTGEPLIVPLAEQAIAILEGIRPITAHRSKYAFPGGRSAARPMSGNAISAALAQMGYKDRHTGHGLRATARTLLVERLGYPVEQVEMQLAHRVADVHGRAYNRTTWLPERRAMMQGWADWLDSLKAGKG